MMPYITDMSAAMETVFISVERKEYTNFAYTKASRRQGVLI